MASIFQICITSARRTFQEPQEIRMCLMNMKERAGAQKYLRKNCYHCIKFTITTFLAAFIWRRRLNSETLVTTTYKKPREVSDGTDTQVKSQMFDKCRVKMIQKELYNVKNPLWKGKENSRKKKGEEAYRQLYIKKINAQEKKSFSDWEFFPICLRSFFQIFSEIVIIIARIH